jgi:hypothetical protein
MVAQPNTEQLFIAVQYWLSLNKHLSGNSALQGSWFLQYGWLRSTKRTGAVKQDTMFYNIPMYAGTIADE